MKRISDGAYWEMCQNCKSVSAEGRSAEIKPKKQVKI